VEVAGFYDNFTFMHMEIIRERFIYIVFTMCTAFTRFNQKRVSAERGENTAVAVLCLYFGERVRERDRPGISVFTKRFVETSREYPYSREFGGRPGISVSLERFLETS